MILITGGKAQGKFRLAKEMFPDAEVSCGAFPDSGFIEGALKDKDLIIDDFNIPAREFFENGTETIEKVHELNACFREVVLITDQVGSGIVPVEKAEREFREWIGRLQCTLAEEADEVIRVICGIGQKIK